MAKSTVTHTLEKIVAINLEAQMTNEPNVINGEVNCGAQSGEDSGDEFGGIDAPDVNDGEVDNGACNREFGSDGTDFTNETDVHNREVNG